MNLPLLQRDSAVVLVIDFQDRLMPSIHDRESVLAAAGRLLKAAHVLHLPVLVTEQYPAGLGRTCSEIATVCAGIRPIEKVRFSAWVTELEVALSRLDRPQVLVVGVEAHVCVQQTVLDLLRHGYVTCVCADAVSSRRVRDAETAMARMRQSGAVITTVESAIFELLGEAGSSEFKQILQIVK